MTTWRSLIGTRIVFWIPNGRGRNGQEYRKKSGRVVLAFDTYCVVNGGGRHGTPHVVDEQNFHGLSRGKKNL